MYREPAKSSLKAVAFGLGVVGGKVIRGCALAGGYGKLGCLEG
jgi:hypothetical protein